MLEERQEIKGEASKIVKNPPHCSFIENGIFALKS